MTTPLIYLASPIDMGALAERRKKATEALRKAGAAVFDPSAGWAVPVQGKPHGGLQEANHAALRHCDGLLVLLDRGILTIGCTLEMHQAKTLGIPTVVLGDNLETSWALAHLEVVTFQADQLTEAVDTLMFEAAP